MQIHTVALLPLLLHLLPPLVIIIQATVGAGVWPGFVASRKAQCVHTLKLPVHTNRMRSKWAKTAAQEDAGDAGGKPRAAHAGGARRAAVP